MIPVSAGRKGDAEAAQWWVRRDFGPLSETESIQFEQWLAQPDNARAYRRLEAAWDVVGLAGNDPALLALRHGARELTAPSRPRMYALVLGALAATCASVVVALAWMSGAKDPVSAPAQQALVYESRVGEQRALDLADGSHVILDTASGIEVYFTPEERVVRLGQGRLLVDVAKDASRPFVVEVGSHRIRALGTRFDVRQEGDQVDVLLIEGSVQVDGPRAAASGSVLLAPGERYRVRAGAPAELDKGVDTARELLWKDGLVEFEDLRLDQAVARLNRYATQPILIRDPQVAAMRISGIFRTHQRERFLEVATSVLPIVARAAPGRADGIELVAVGTPE